MNLFTKSSFNWSFGIKNCHLSSLLVVISSFSSTINPFIIVKLLTKYGIPRISHKLVEPTPCMTRSTPPNKDKCSLTQLHVTGSRHLSSTLVVLSYANLTQSASTLPIEWSPRHPKISCSGGRPPSEHCHLHVALVLCVVSVCCKSFSF